jgi:hypothetical protein
MPDPFGAPRGAAFGAGEGAIGNAESAIGGGMRASGV